MNKHNRPWWFETNGLSAPEGNRGKTAATGLVSAKLTYNSPYRHLFPIRREDRLSSRLIMEDVPAMVGHTHELGWSRSRQTRDRWRLWWRLFLALFFTVRVHFCNLQEDFVLGQ